MIPSRSLEFMDGEDREAETPAAPEALGEAESDGATPDVFVRSISTPPGLPWEQTRAADLEARHGSPLPLADVLFRVRRLEGWRPGGSGRFAAFYVLTSEVDERLEASAEVEGRTVDVTFVTGRAVAVQAGLAALRTGAIVALLGLVVLSAFNAWNRRGDLESALQVTDLRIDNKLRRAEAARAGRDLERFLSDELERGPPLRDAVADLSWLANAKAADARVEAIHWEPGLLAVTVRGEASPFQAATDREVRRAARAVRPGVWLWGVTGPRPSGAPVAAEVRP